ncbi:MAG: bifunctional hydroxymethylpyrimidine kinase/phosphomethylpyrimidine kinase [Candidatus Sumerlaeia bacterium]|nr:bifunctional hydroxymethylpyrimidine kinase/phosphomethylpyrimidine kinase [Candidatus Sumerlaeia bacterium]
MRTGVVKVLTIAGSDPGGGAGIQADLKTFQALGVYGMAVITALTVQNTTGVRATNVVAEKIVADQLEFLLNDIKPEATKTGMLGTKEIVSIVAKKIRKFQLKKVVVDPVMFASSGKPLLNASGIAELKRSLLSLATVVTPNLREASVLSGFEVKTIEDMLRAAEIIKKLGVSYVLIKGGHLPQSEQAVDILFDGNGHTFLPGYRFAKGEEVHGTGCVFSAALTAYLAEGNDILTAAKKAKEFVFQSICNAVKLGAGQPQTNTILKQNY